MLFPETDETEDKDSMSEYFPKWDVFVRYDPLPAHVAGFACYGQGAEGIDQIAVINSRLEGDALVDAVAHEVAHHVDGDLHRDELPLDLVERHSRLWRPEPARKDRKKEDP